MSLNDLKANKLTEEEMDNVSGGRSGTETGLRIYTYTVKKGDCLSVIAQKVGVSMDNLVKWNATKYPGLKNNRDYIEVNWVLTYYK